MSLTSDKLTVLILEDTPADAELIASALRSANLEFTAVQVSEEDEFYSLLQKYSPDLIFADNSLLAANEKCVLSTSRSLHPAVPFIVISDTPGEEAAVEAVRRGATDYVLKQRLARLGPVVERALQESRQTDRAEAGHAIDCKNERPNHDSRICELNQLLRAIREINRLILRERQPEVLLADACSILIRTRGYLHVGIGLVESRMRSVPPVTRSSREAEYLDSFSILWSGNADVAVPARSAIHSGVSWTCQDVANDPRFALWKDPALACGCASVAAVPLIHWGQVTGAMTVCSERPNAFHHEEIRVLEQLAGDLAFALEGIYREQAYRSAEARLHLLSSALQSTANSIVITNRSGHVLWTNPAFTELTGYSFAEVAGKTTNVLKSGKHDQAFYRELWETVMSGRVWRSEIINRRKDGSLYTEDCTITPVRNKEGEIENFIAVKQDITERKRTEEALQASMTRILRQESTLMALTKREDSVEGDSSRSLRRLTESAAWALNVARVSVWRCVPEKQSLQCVDLFELPENRHSQGVELEAAAYPAYFQALAEQDVIATEDAQTDPRTCEFTEGYLKRFGITSMMDVPIRLHGRLEGVLCVEHTGPTLQWPVDQRTFAIAISNLVSLQIEEAERKQAEKALWQSQQAYASLVNTVDGIVWESDAQTFRFSFVSKQAERLLGYPVEDWLKNPEFWKEHIHPDDRDLAVNFCVTATREMRDHDFRYRMMAADGRVIWVHDLVAVIVENGQPARLRGIIVDITQSKLAEEALCRRTAFFEALVDSSLDGILVVDKHGKKILQNRRMNELWKIPPEIADDPDDSRQVEFVKTHAKNPQQFADRIARLYSQTDEISRSEVEMIDGTVLDRYSSPVRDKDGTYYGRIWAFRDITERRQLEAQFRQSQKMEAIGQLAGGVAHDFNNILTAVMMYLGILRTTLTDEDATESLKELEVQVKRAADLTKQLLMFSRKSAIEVKPLDLNQVVGEMRKMLQRLLGEHVQVDFQGAAALPTVEADLGMMQQVIMNLAVNGRDAMPEGGQLIISTGLAEFDERTAVENSDRRSGNFVRLSVSDTGCGMDEKTRKRIFEPFFTTKELGKGTGLGLATVYGIAQQHRGWIEVTSQLGKGSTFEVFLPVSDKAHSTSGNEDAPIAHGGRETILLVEDEPMVRLFTARRLQTFGYRVLEATDGKMAMELWSRHSDGIQLMLTDMIMPYGINGLELAERFQKEKPGLKVIIMSGYSAEISSQGIPTKPGILYLSKPFETVNLTKTIRTCLDQKTI